MVDRTRLESGRTLTGTGSSNLPLSASRAGDLRFDADARAGSYLRVQTPEGAFVTPTGGYFTPWSGSGRVYDGTTDGHVNYFVDHGGSPGEIYAGVYVADYYWQNPSLLFGLSGGWSGIAYDPYDNSLWLSWRSGGIAEYSLTGDYLAGFPTSVGYISALGLDPMDHTLWMFALDSGYPQPYVAQFALAQYSLAQTFLQPAQSTQVSNGAFGILWPHASGPQQRVPTNGSVSLVLTNRTPPPFFAAS